MRSHSGRGWGNRLGGAGLPAKRERGHAGVSVSDVAPAAAFASGRWLMTQRWNDLLFAHWPVAAPQIAALLPEGLEADTFQGSAWLGVVPFWLDRIKIRGMPPIPGRAAFLI